MGQGLRLDAAGALLQRRRPVLGGLLRRMGSVPKRPGAGRQGRHVGDRLDGAEDRPPKPRGHRQAKRDHPAGGGSAGDVPGGARSPGGRRSAAGKQVRRPARRRAASARNDERAERVCAFIENLTVPSGVGVGRPIRLRDWQRDFIFDVYAPQHTDGSRLVRRAIFSLGRKNGKTLLAAALVLVHLVGPEAERNGEIYSAANDREQAGQVFKMARQMVEAEPELTAVLRVVQSTKTIACYGNGSFYRALSAEVGTKHGLNPTFVIFDELAQARNRDLYDVLDTSMAARAEPLFLAISTQSNDPEHICSKLIDDGLSGEDPTTVCHLYAAPEDCDLEDEEAWYAANPALGDFRSFDELAVAARKAKRLPAEEPKVRNLYLNQRVSPNSTLISRGDWMACKGDASLVEGEAIYLALDLSAKIDLCALVAVSVETGSRVAAWFWKPADYLEEHERRDRVPYALWASQGRLEAIPGRSVHPTMVSGSSPGGRASRI